MKHYNFVIVGAGSAGRTAAETLAEKAPDESILIIDAEDNLPCKRTRVSKNVKAGYEPDDFAVHEMDWYQDNGVELMKGQAVIRMDPDAHTLTLESGSLSYSSLLLATGARPRIPFTMPPGNWSTLWTVRDGLALHEKFTDLNNKYAEWGLDVAISTGDRADFDSDLMNYDIIIATSEVCASFVMINPRPNLRFPCPNLPSIGILETSSSRSCLFCRFNSFSF